jgi:hypothetical protein
MMMESWSRTVEGHVACAGDTPKWGIYKMCSNYMWIKISCSVAQHLIIYLDQKGGYFLLTKLTLIDNDDSCFMIMMVI